MLVTITAMQHQTGQQLTLEQRLHIFKQRPDFVCLPEYCLIQESDTDFSRAAMHIKEDLDYLRNLSIEFSTCLIAGSVVEGADDSLYNSSYIFNRGSIVGRYRKMSPVDGELGQGILPGDKIFIATIDDIKIAVLICADAMNAGLFDLLFEQKADIIFIPTTSPYRPAESKSQKFKRDNDIFLAASQRAGAYIVKTCGVGNLFNKPLQGRSLIISPWGFIKRVPTYAEREESIMTATLDIDEIREFHSKKEIRDLSNANS